MAEAPNEATPTPKSESSHNPMADLYTGLTEETFFKSPLVSDSYRPPYNPDDLWQKKGDYSVYETMLHDDQVSVCLQLKKDLVLGDGGQFEPGEEGQDEMIEELKTIFFEEYEGDFSEDLEEVLTNYEFGFSITEKIFKLREGMRLGLKNLRTRHPNSWKLHQDDKGAVTKFEQITSQGNLDVNPNSIIHVVNNKRFQNPYGNSDLRTAYNAWFTKTQVVRYFAMFLEKAASPTPVGKYNKNAPQSAVDKLFETLKRFQNKTAIVIPDDIQVDFLESKNSGEAYVKAIHLFNMFIGRSLFIPDLLGFTGSETGGGSLALGKEQMNLFFMHINRRRANLENLINKHLVQTLTIYNYGILDNVPKFRFKPLDDMKAVELAKTWLEAVKGKTYKPNPEEINHFRKLVKFPEGEVEFNEPAPSPFGAAPGIPGEKPKPPGQEAADEDAEKPDEDPKKETQKNFGKVYNLPKGNYHKKVNFKKIETKLSDYDQSVQDETRKVTKKILFDLADQIEKKNILKNQNAERINSISLKYKKDLKQILKASFIELFKDSQAQAASELDKGNFAKPLTSEAFLAMIEQETFNFVGKYEYTILERVRMALIAAIKDGTSLNTVLGVLSDDLEQLSSVQIERFARTKHTEVMNNARVEFFDSTGVVSAYQYSAILDDRTSDICAGLDGKIFKAGDEPIPPMHFNCRSVLIPITKYEEYETDDKVKGQNIDDFIDENKGTGFSTK